MKKRTFPSSNTPPGKLGRSLVLAAGIALLLTPRPAGGGEPSCPCNRSGPSLRASQTILAQPFTLTLTGPPGATFALFGSRSPDSSDTPIGRLCLSRAPEDRFRIFVDSIRGIVRPSLRLSETGVFEKTVRVPNRPSLSGRRYYLQAAVSSDTLPVLSNSLVVIPGQSEEHHRVGTLGIDRTHAAASRLPDGRVLITGGGTADAIRFAIDATPTTEIYDPVCQSVSFSDSMSYARGLHSMTPLPNGKLLLCGGVSSEFEVLRTAEEFDPVTERFSTVGPMFRARYGHTATLLGDGTVLILGGSSSIDDLGSAFASSLSTAEIYDPVSQSFSLVPDLLDEARSGHASVLLPDGRVLVIGGAKAVTQFGGPDLALKGEVYEPLTRSFLPVGEFRLPRTVHAAQKLPDGRVLIAGGLLDNLSVTDRCELFDPSVDQFFETGPLLSPRALPRLVPLPNGLILETGGLESLSTAAGVDFASIYDPATETFSPTGRLIGPRAGHALIGLSDGSVLSIGGAIDAANSERSLEVYSP